MRELSVYYCPECGYYGYYQLAKNAKCPRCETAMILLSISYQDFMNLDCKERDELLSEQIITSSSPFVRRLVAPHKTHNNRELIARLVKHITHLEEENKKLTDTIGWMHQTVWDLVRENKALKRELEKSHHGEGGG